MAGTNSKTTSTAGLRIFSLASLQAVNFLLIETEDDTASCDDYGPADQIWLAYHHANGFGPGRRIFLHVFPAVELIARVQKIRGDRDRRLIFPARRS